MDSKDQKMIGAGGFIQSCPFINFRVFKEGNYIK